MSAEVELDRGVDVSASRWIPTCPVPDRLWDVYRGRGAATMVTSAREAAESDLRALGIPSGFSGEVFVGYVAGILRQMPLVVEVDRRATSGLTDSEAYEVLRESLGMEDSEDAENAWRTLKAWLVYFFSETYRVEPRQEVFIKGRHLSM